MAVTYSEVSRRGYSCERIDRAAEREGDSVLARAVSALKKTPSGIAGLDEITSVLRSYGVEYAQGYHIGRPRPLTAVGQPQQGAAHSDGTSDASDVFE